VERGGLKWLDVGCVGCGRASRALSTNVAKLPNHDAAGVDRRKVTGYLLSRTHAVGRAKAEFFEPLGFQQSHPELLEVELKRIARDENVVATEDTGFGTRYIVPGHLTGPVAAAHIVTVWIIDHGSELPRLVTVWPAS